MYVFGNKELYVEVVPSPQFIVISCNSVVNIGWEIVNVADISDPEFWYVIVGDVTVGATLP